MTEEGKGRAVIDGDYHQTLTDITAQEGKKGKKSKGSIAKHTTSSEQEGYRQQARLTVE